MRRRLLPAGVAVLAIGSSFVLSQQREAEDPNRVLQAHEPGGTDEKDLWRILVLVGIDDSTRSRWDGGVAVENGGTPQARVRLDASGNAVGGVRSPYVDVPTATYVTSTGGPGTCGNLAHQEAFDWARLETLYGSSRNYAAKVAASVDQLVKARWLTDADGRRIKAERISPRLSRN